MFVSDTVIGMIIYDFYAVLSFVVYFIHHLFRSVCCVSLFCFAVLVSLLKLAHFTQFCFLRFIIFALFRTLY